MRPPLWSNLAPKPRELVKCALCGKWAARIETWLIQVRRADERGDYHETVRVCKPCGQKGE